LGRSVLRVFPFTIRSAPGVFPTAAGGVLRGGETNTGDIVPLKIFQIVDPFI
jgi:hypothetical protein